MQQNGELSVEEILESIKKVIARDNKESAVVERHRRETEGVILRGPGATFGLTPIAETGNDDEADEDEYETVEAQAEDDGEVLDLGDAATEMLEEDDGEEDGAEDDGAEDGVLLTGSEAIAADDADDNELIEPLVEADPADDQPVAILPAEPETFTPVEALAAMPDTPASQFETASPEGETPLERMVRDSLRPMLREWLDTNLPPIVERMVKSELERIMGKSS